MTTDVAAAERWKRIEALFQEVADLDPASRAAFLDRACEADAEMRREVDSLLAASGNTLAGLRGSVAAAAGEMLSAQGQTRDRIGAYRLIRVLGEGGMGAVYLGARDDEQYERLVAIKVIRAGLAHSAALQLRFRGERQILADLDHPNIARMLDGGITSDGLPYLVMEYIDGIALDVFCRERRLSLDARLGVFRTLCSAVDYAHRHLVIHRDIKPLNVLVTEDGSPKLLDFGIAKLIDPYQGEADDSAISLTGQRLLTPDYASPEQLLGKPVSAATDVYALGCLLFELLTGELPFALADPSARTRAICEDEPERASAACLRTGHLPPKQARRLRGDLDCILLKAMRKEPEQRYATASQLLAEIDRYLGGYAVEAAGAGAAYRATKFVKRHRVGVGLTALVALLIVGFAIGMAVLARRATRGEAKARREQEFLAGIFNASTPEAAKGATVTARELLDQAAGRVDTELASDPQLQGALAEDIGQAYVALGLYDQAQPLLERALRLAQMTAGERSDEYVNDLSNLANNDRLRSKFQLAEPLFRRTVALNQAAHGRESLAVAHSLSSLGEVLYWEDRDAEAEAVLRRALTIERPLPDSAQDATRNYLALVLERRGAYPEAAGLLREMTAITARTRGRESQDYLVAMHDMAGAQIDMGDLDGAAATEAQVLATRQRIWGRDHPDTAYSLNNLGWIFLEQGKWREAQPLLREEVAITRKEGGGPVYLGALGNWGRLLEQKGDLSGAAAAFDHAQSVLAADGRAQSWTAAKLLVYQALLAMDRGQPEEAVRIAARAVDLQRQLGGDSNPQLATGLLALGQAQLLSGDAHAAESSFRSALAIRRREYPATHPELLLAEARLAEALLDEKRGQDALMLLQPAVRNAETAPFPLTAWRMAELRVLEGRALRASGSATSGRQAEALIAANTSALAGYNQAAMRRYLSDRIRSAGPHS
jgi:serine/threonine-protein kinase